MIHDNDVDAALEKQGITVLRRGDERYPRRLENLQQPPEVLYCRGNLELLTRPAVAIVGTRDCTRYGIDVAKRFAAAFAESGIVVVSGLADGIDTAAHVGAGAGNTIAVLGNGVRHYYPTANMALQDEIAAKGLLVSEYPPGDRGHKAYFPQRNRIVAALSRALLIVEADMKSGTMITKDFALELGMDVFAVPGQITSSASRGTNDLIKQAACAIATEPADVLEVFGAAVKTPAEGGIVMVSFDEKQILDILGRDEVHFDEIIEKSKMPVPRLATLISEMEIKGLVERIAGNHLAAR